MPAPVGHAFLRRRRRLRAGLTQLVLVLAGFALGLVTPRFTRGPNVPARQVTEMLLGLGLGLLGAVAVIFSLLFLVVQWAATNFTPRLTLFRDDPIVWRTFAFAAGLAVFSLTAALAIGSRAEVSLIVPVIAVLLVFVMLYLLRTLQLRAFAAIQLAPAVSSIAAQGRAVLEAVYPDRTPDVDPSPVAPLPPLHATLTWPHPPKVLQRIHVDRLLNAARTADAVVVLHEAPGATLSRGAPLADVHGGTLPVAAIIDAIVGGSERTFEQDPLLAVRLLADITLRSLAPAVNDPATAVQVLDEIEDLLDCATAASTEPLRLHDSDGQLRIVIPLPVWEDFVRTGIDDVIPAAASSPMTLQRLQKLLARLRSRVQPLHRPMLDARLARVDELAQRFSYVPVPHGADRPPD
ncbi:DUF2254 family protein [Nocardia sp. GTS18]|uniref:DUF2254 family protein n=1 Tax=Nocardia sp. GTS18 TaxID=1778064 RepID=UPI0015EFCCB6|nr:DUF2254 family protein [Nocardia sp. GTS18]